METKVPCKSCGEMRPKSEVVTRFTKFNIPGKVFVRLKRCNRCEAKAWDGYAEKAKAKR